jgi:hypothetical protein
MGPVERFTRDSASKYVWSSLMLASILAFVFTLIHGGDAVEDERLAAEGRAVDMVAEVLDPRLDAGDLSAPISDHELAGLREAGREILGDPRVARVRIWAEDGDLLFSTDRDDDIGSNAALNDQVLRQAAVGTSITRWGLSDTGGTDEPGRSLVRTYTPIRSDAVAEVDQTSEGTISPVRWEWRRYQLLAGALAILFLGLTVLSLRDPIERINTGVSFAPSGIPAGYSLIGDERLHAVEEVYRLAHDRVARLEERLAESESIRRSLEGDIQRALTTAATEPTRPRTARPLVAAASGEPPAAPQAPPPEPAPQPEPAPAPEPASEARPPADAPAPPRLRPRRSGRRARRTAPRRLSRSDPAGTQSRPPSSRTS